MSTPSADFSLIRYAQCWEDADVLVKGLDIQPGARCLSICSAVDNTLALLTRDPAQVLALDLSPIDLRVPDHRELLTERAPGFTLLMWDKGALAMHACPAGDFPAAVTYEVPFIKDQATAG